MPGDVIDLCIGWGPWPGEHFLDFLVRYAAVRSLTCVVCTDTNVHSLIRASESGRRRILVHLDTLAAYEEDASDPYHRLTYAAKDGGALVVNEPDHSKLGANKAVIHYHFERARIPLPRTVVVRNWEPSTFRLTPAERTRLGRPFIAKPARGYGKRGVIRLLEGTAPEIARARRFDRGDDFLLQELVEPEWLGGRRGWFRIYFVLGEVIPCWWDDRTEHFFPVTLDEFHRFALDPLCRIVNRVARLTHMAFFSTEFAVVRRGSRRRFLAIDYVNDPCDMTVQSRSHCGVPDAVVLHIAERLVDAAWRIKKGLSPFKGTNLWFAD
ncbi:MAG: ATP-grasp domain-containing protein [Planctomycetota bacterium]|jgi:hypothetical protein